jgi:hypothetical protein
MQSGDIVRLSGGIRRQPMVIARVDGLRVLCSWRWSDGSVRSDWFALCSLRMVQERRAPFVAQSSGIAAPSEP